MKIRNHVFETNSSSSHSITISNNTDEQLLDFSLIPNGDGELHLSGGTFGWEHEYYYDADTKANYIAIYIDGWCNDNDEKADFKTIFETVLKIQTGATRITYDLTDSYIDHESVEGNALHYLFVEPEQLRQFIFNTKSCLETDGDG